jgi:hypothetical protein
MKKFTLPAFFTFRHRVTDIKGAGSATLTCVLQTPQRISLLDILNVYFYWINAHIQNLQKQNRGSTFDRKNIQAYPHVVSSHQCSSLHHTNRNNMGAIIAMV